jgi:hypothetical protein
VKRGLKGLCATPAPTEAQALISRLTVECIQDTVERITQVEVEKTRLQLLVISIALAQGANFAFLDDIGFHHQLARAVCISQPGANQPVAAPDRYPVLREAQEIYNVEREAAHHAGGWVDGNNTLTFMAPFAEENRVMFMHILLPCQFCMENNYTQFNPHVLERTYCIKIIKILTLQTNLKNHAVTNVRGRCITYWLAVVKSMLLAIQPVDQVRPSTREIFP